MKSFDVSRLVDDRPAEGIFRVHRDVFADPDLFELEMKYIFGRTWVFLAVESQLARPHDYVSAWIGRTPVLVMRDAAGRLGAFLDLCPHKGTQLTHSERGSARVHVCPYHGWAFDASGKNVGIKDHKAACYPESFDRFSHDLVPVARLASYGGLVFGSLSADVPPLEEYLGEMKTFIDLAMQQGAQGMEVIPGRVAYIYRGNWKLQMDNGLDQYHLTTTHISYMDLMVKRARGDGHTEAHQFDWKKRMQQECGSFNFRNGHAITWINQAEVEKRPVYATIDEVRQRVGGVRAEWMLKGRNNLVFPNMQIADVTTLNVRTFRPISVDRTEMRVYALAPIGEASATRQWRLRQFEDFFSASGFASPDDSAVFEAGQRGFAAETYDYLQGFSRGGASLRPGADERARALGIEPVSSQHGMFELNSETAHHSPYREWARLMQAGLDAERQEAAA
ncbi:benzoate 1,2-dioxygenase large subunit [Pigmentiphaga soli]|uniref:Benzoate 1,2-dioxygenase large subunit n=1 Tax=Pigmentiphaga soli TaxID=1007095 RepID=A0ABP8HPK5_9BURK